MSLEDGVRMSYYQANEQSEPEMVKISTAKQLHKAQGGKAWTEHYDRDGGLFETTPIRLAANNSAHHYNVHL